MHNLAQEARHAHATSPKLLSETDTHSQPNLYRAILSSDLPEDEKTADKMANHVFELLGAGSLSTAKIATTATFHLLENPEILSRLRHELIKGIPSVSVIPTVAELEKMSYLVSFQYPVSYLEFSILADHLHKKTAVIKEALRVACLITSRLPMVCPDKSLQYKEWIIPPGVRTPYSQHITKESSNC